MSRRTYASYYGPDLSIGVSAVGYFSDIHRLREHSFDTRIVSPAGQGPRIVESITYNPPCEANFNFPRAILSQAQKTNAIRWIM